MSTRLVRSLTFPASSLTISFSSLNSTLVTEFLSLDRPDHIHNFFGGGGIHGLFQVIKNFESVDHYLLSPQNETSYLG